MPDKYFVDTNVLIYAHDSAAGRKHDRARRLIEHLWRTGEGVLSTQVLQELCINLRRKLAKPLAPHDVREILEDYLNWQIVVNTPDLILRALDIEARYKTSFWDSLLLQAAITSGAEILYSEDFADGQKYGTIQVVNPLLAEASPF